MNNIDIHKIRESALAELNEPPTDKQITYVEAIAETLNLPLPDIKTKAAYRMFISLHRSDYINLMNEVLKEEGYWFEELGG